MLGLLPNPAFLALFAGPLDLLQQCPQETLEKAAYGDLVKRSIERLNSTDD